MSRAARLRPAADGAAPAAELLPAGRPTELVRDRVAALRTLTEDLLEVARLDARREEAQLGVHVLGPLVAAITRRAGVAAEVVGADCPAPVRTDVRRQERPGAGDRRAGDPVPAPTGAAATVTLPAG
ncbi:hypothetical protein [Streptomyces sp. NBC_01296]|uniref:hypothetical protein n=1 Tax=Streptomyces sp. NBC_01296 TaxID=2903816 RepID=UPI003FA39300